MVRSVYAGFLPGQACFDFIPFEEAQDRTTRNLDSIERARLRRSAPPRPLTPKVIRSDQEALKQIPLDLLSEPLIAESQSQYQEPLRAVYAEVREDLGNVYAGVTTEEEDRDGWCGDWSFSAVDQLHEATLLHSLAVLAGRGNSEEKLDTLRWFFTSDIYCWTRKTSADGPVSYQPVWAHQIPFTFQRCCAVSGKSHEAIRDGLIYILRKAGLGEYIPKKEYFQWKINPMRGV